MGTLDWSQCPAVESTPGKRSRIWVFKHTRTPVSVVFDNLEWERPSRKSWSGFICRVSRWSL